jgi:CHAT domain-containing protein/outer membrane protein assembly factor BamB
VLLALAAFPAAGSDKPQPDPNDEGVRLAVAGDLTGAARSFEEALARGERLDVLNNYLAVLAAQDPVPANYQSVWDRYIHAWTSAPLDYRAVRSWLYWPVSPAQWGGKVHPTHQTLTGSLAGAELALLDTFDAGLSGQSDKASFLTNLACQIATERTHGAPPVRFIEARGEGLLGQERYTEAIAEFQRCLDSPEATIEDRFRAMRNMAAAQAKLGAAAQANALYASADALYGQAFPDNPVGRQGLHYDWAEAELTAGNPAHAVKILQEAMDSTASLDLGYMGLALQLSGRTEEAIEQYERAIRQTRVLPGGVPIMGAQPWNRPDPHWDRWASEALRRWAGLLGARGQPSKALALLGRAARGVESDLVATSPSSPGFGMAVDDLRETVDQIITLDRQHSTRESALLAFDGILMTKGRELAAYENSRRTLREVLDPAGQSDLRELTKIQSQLAREQASSMPDVSRVIYLQWRLRSLESGLVSRASTYTPVPTPTWESVQKAIPNDGALIEWAHWRPFNPSARRLGDRFGPTHLVAYVLRSAGEPRGADLGLEADIESMASELRRQAGTDPEGRALGTDLETLARELDRRIFRPARKLAGRAHLLLLAPEGVLNVLPFAALIGPTGRYIIEDYSLSYVASARDLLEPASSGAPQPPAILAAPEFATWGRYHWSPLDGAKEEAAAIAPLLGVTPVEGRDATVTALRALAHPAVLHLATHGNFFLSDPANTAAGRGLASPKEDSVQGPAKEPVQSPAKSTNHRALDPLLRSVIVLAPEPGDQSLLNDGIVSALELSALDLTRTQMVVLSACQTGLGEIRNGEGVVGIRRALSIAGAQTQVTTLWSVDDLSTRDLMSAFYSRLTRDGEGRSDALRDAQLSILRSKSEARWRDPYYWAAFTTAGKWGPVRLGTTPIATPAEAPPIVPTGRAWETKLGGECNVDPVAAGGLVIAACSHAGLFGVDVSTGDVRWSYPSEWVIRYPIALGDGAVYFGEGWENTPSDRAIVALDATTGTERWRYAVSGSWSTTAGPLAFGAGIVIAPILARDGQRLQALRSSDGTPLWSHALDRSSIVWAPSVGPRSIEFALDTIGQESATLVSLDAASGEERWRSAGAGTATSISHERGIIYGVSETYSKEGKKTVTFHATDRQTGKTAWTLDLGEHSGAGAIGVFDGLATITASFSMLVVDTHARRVVWRVDRTPAFATHARAVGNAIISNGEKGLSVIKGRELLTLPVEGRVRTAPVDAGNRVFVITDAGLLCAFE